MSQLFNVVKCFQCLTYQVDINKRSTNKWTCKLCSAKQTLKQIHYQGSSKECRLRVQTMNKIKNEVKEEINLKRVQNNNENNNNNEFTANNYNLNYTSFKDQQQQQQSSNNEINQDIENDLPKAKRSKWAKYLEKDDDEDDDDN